MKKKPTGLSKGLGKFSKLDSFDAAFAKKPRPSTARSPAGKSKLVETLTSEPSFKGNTAFRPLAGGGKVKRYFAG
jgi:hypothetical protein